MPSLHFLLAAAKEGDRDALLGLQTGHQGQQGGILGQGGGGGGGLIQHSRDVTYDESTLTRSNSSSSSNNVNIMGSLNNNGGCSNGNNNGNMGRQVIHGAKNSPTDWLLSSGGDAFRSTGTAAAADADLFSYQMPVKPSSR